MDHAPPSSRQSLVRVLGTFTATMIVIGSMIGSGIFRKPGPMAQGLLEHGIGTPEALLGVWALAGVITLCGALTIAELSSIYPRTGGQYVYFEHAYGRFFAFLYGWAVIVVIQTGSIASLASVFGEYLGRVVTLPESSEAMRSVSLTLPGIGAIHPFDDIGVKLAAGGLIVLLTAVNYCGVRFGGTVANIVTSIKIATLAAIIILAFAGTADGTTPLPRAAAITVGDVGWMAVALAIAGALQKAFWAYDGWANVTYIGGEVREPQRTVPRALIVGTLVVICIYVLANLAYTHVLPMEVMAGTKLVAADTAAQRLSDGARWIALAVMISAFGATNGTTLASARVPFAMARDGMMPKAVGRAHPRFHTPGVALVVQGVWSIVLVFSGTFDILTDMLVTVAWVFYGAAALGVLILRRRSPEMPRPYRVPGYPAVPILFVLVSLIFVVLSVANDVEQYRAGETQIVNSALGLLLLLPAVPLYLYFRRRNRITTEEGH